MQTSLKMDKLEGWEWYDHTKHKPTLWGRLVWWWTGFKNRNIEIGFEPYDNAEPVIIYGADGSVVTTDGEVIVEGDPDWFKNIGKDE